MLPYSGCGAYLFALPLTREVLSGRCAFFPPGLWLIRIFNRCGWNLSGIPNPLGCSLFGRPQLTGFSFQAKNDLLAFFSCSLTAHMLLHLILRPSRRRSLTPSVLSTASRNVPVPHLQRTRECAVWDASQVSSGRNGAR